MTFNSLSALAYYYNAYGDCIAFSRTHEIGHLGKFEYFNFVIDAPTEGGKKLDDFLTRMYNRYCRKGAYRYDAYFALLLSINCILPFCTDEATERVLQKWQLRLELRKSTWAECGITEDDMCDFFQVMD